VISLKGMELRGAGNWCLDVPSSNFAAGQYLQLFACQNSANQQWSIFDGRVIKSSSSSFCLEVPNGTATVNKLLRLATCTYGPAQQFTFTSAGEIRFGGLCVDARGGSPALALQLFDCKPDGPDKRNQQWHLSGPIRGLDGQCLDIPNGRGYDGTPVQLFRCTGGTNQRWDVYFR
jgi:endo-1,4-beta-xylanase